MKKYLFGAAAVLAIAAPAAAFAQSGYVGATYSSVDSDAITGDDDSWGVDGAVAFSGQGSLGFELDAGYADSGDSDGVWGLGGHLFGRTDTHLLGVFAAYSDSDEVSTWSAGVEGEKYYNNWTLAGAVGYANSDELDADGWGANAQLRYFVTDNLRLQGDLGWTSVDIGSDDADVINYGLGGEWRISTTPISLLAGWTHLDSGDFDTDADILSIGARWNFGAGSLKDRDRHGASLAGLSGVSTALGL